MERSFFLSKLSFAVLVWLAIVFNMPAHSGSLKHYVENISNTTNHSINQLLHIPTYNDIKNAVSSLVPQESNVKAIPKDDLQCMAENIFYEAATQSYVGKIAVGMVVLNRVKTPGYPDTVCKVIYEGSQNIHTSTCQFSWTCAPRKGIDKTSLYWRQSLAAANDLLTKKDAIIDVTEGATSYHADYVNPAWSKQLHFVTQIDQHIFYKKLR
jgi:spore germination cell wall hydrolase CwlJ-like protein